MSNGSRCGRVLDGLIGKKKKRNDNKGSSLLKRIRILFGERKEAKGEEGGGFLLEWVEILSYKGSVM